MDDLINKSKDLFDSGFGCAEAVLMVAAESKNIQSDLIPRIATGLCGGMGKSDGVCGAISGGVLAISMIHGRDSAEDPRDVLNEKVNEFIQSFKSKFGSTGCTQLTGCNLSTKEGLDKFKELNKHGQCKEFVGEATRMVLQKL